MIYKIHIGQINLIARGEQRELTHTHTRTDKSNLLHIQHVHNYRIQTNLLQYYYTHLLRSKYCDVRNT